MIKYLKLMVLASILIAALITGFSINTLINSAPVAGNDLLLIPASGITTEEYYYKPAGDDRLWHVINMYNINNNSNGSMQINKINNSEYIFTNELVTVINEINNQ